MDGKKRSDRVCEERLPQLEQTKPKHDYADTFKIEVDDP